MCYDAALPLSNFSLRLMQESASSRASFHIPAFAYAALRFDSRTCEVPATLMASEYMECVCYNGGWHQRVDERKKVAAGEMHSCGILGDSLKGFVLIHELVALVLQGISHCFCCARFHSSLPLRATFCASMKLPWNGTRAIMKLSH